MERFKNKWVARKGCREGGCLQITEAPELDSFYDCTKQSHSQAPALSQHILLHGNQPQHRAAEEKPPTI